MIAFFLWCGMAALVLIEEWPNIAKLTAIDQLWAVFILMFFGPTFLLADVGDFLLNNFLTGWDNNDHIDKY